MTTSRSQEETEIGCIEAPEYVSGELMHDDSIKLTRLELLKITGSVIHYLKKKATAGRFNDQDLERLRDSKMRLLLEACKVHASVLKDEESGEIEKRLVDIENVIKERIHA